LPTFKDAWNLAKQGETSGLFASDYAYGSHNQRAKQKRQQQQRQNTLTPQQKSYRQAVYHPQPNPTVWSEYGGHSQSRYTGYSPIVMEANSRRAQAVFAQAEYTLSKFKSRW
jgi:hypothetical protein